METRRPVALIAGIVTLLAAQSAMAERVQLNVPLGVPLTSRGYERIAHKHGVTVYQHKTADNIRLGTEGVLNAPPEQVAHALVDYERQRGKIGRLSEVRILGCRPGQLSVYQRLNLPVIDDRDFNLQVRWGRLGAGYWISYWAVPRGVAPREGVVRLSTHSGTWQLQPLPGGKATQVRFMVDIDMAGLLPKWMARSGSAKEMPILFQQVNRLLGEPDRRIACSR